MKNAKTIIIVGIVIFVLVMMRSGKKENSMTSYSSLSKCDQGRTDDQNDGLACVKDCKIVTSTMISCLSTCRYVTLPNLGGYIYYSYRNSCDDAMTDSDYACRINCIYNGGSTCNNPADTNTNCIIVDSELISYINRWLSSQVTDSQLITVINIWLNGGSYQ